MLPTSGHKTHLVSSARFCSETLLGRRPYLALPMLQPCQQLTILLLDVQVQVIETTLDWAVLGAIPEMLQTAYGSLFTSLQLKKGDRLLIRGGTTSVGLAAAAIAKNNGNYVAATTRKAASEKLVLASGADKVFIDDGSIAGQVCL